MSYKPGWDNAATKAHDAASVADTATIDMTLTGQEIKGDCITQMSITSDASGLKLSGDNAAPGANQVYGTDAGGTKGWKADPAGGGAPGGADTNVQYNDGGAFGGDANFTWDKTNKILAVTGIINPTFPTGTSNMVMGTGAGASLAVGGNLNTAFGISALATCATADNNACFGYYAGNLTTGGNNVFAGYYAGKDSGACDYCVGIGTSALQAVTGDRNVGIGNSAGYKITSGGYNTLIGDSASGESCVTSNYNVGIGYRALYGSGASTKTSDSNVAVGCQALYAADTANYNTAVGRYALQALNTGDYNAALGYGAGWTATSGEKNVYLGYKAGYSGNGSTSIFIGYYAGYYETGSNTLMIDNAVRTNEADARVKALIYGIFAAAVANQSLTINGRLILQDDATQPPLNLTARSAAPSTPNANDIYLDDGTNTGDSAPHLRAYIGAAWVDL